MLTSGLGRHQRTMWSPVFCTALTALWPSAHAGEWEVQSYSPYAGDSYPSNIYCGDMHVHASYSSHDAYIGGWNRVDPAVAGPSIYRSRLQKGQLSTRPQWGR